MQLTTGKTLIMFCRLPSKPYNRDYDTHSFIQQEGCAWGAEWIEASLANLKCFELGAGTGLFTHHLLARQADALVISDIDSTKLAQARTKYPTVTACCLDAFGPLPGTWDRLYSAHLLQWCPNPLQTLKAWRLALRPTGRLLAVGLIAPTLTEWYQHFPTPVQWYDASCWLQAFESAGWEILRSTYQTKHYSFRTPLDLLRVLHVTGPAYNSPRSYIYQRPDRQSSLRRRLRSFSSLLPQPFETPWTFLRIEATAAV